MNNKIICYCLGMIRENTCRDENKINFTLHNFELFTIQILN